MVEPALRSSSAQVLFCLLVEVERLHQKLLSILEVESFPNEIRDQARKIPAMSILEIAPRSILLQTKSIEHELANPLHFYKVYCLTCSVLFSMVSRTNSLGPMLVRTSTTHILA